MLDVTCCIEGVVASKVQTKIWINPGLLDVIFLVLVVFVEPLS